MRPSQYSHTMDKFAVCRRVLNRYITRPHCTVCGSLAVTRFAMLCRTT
jgi:hypothetical protein